MLVTTENSWNKDTTFRCLGSSFRSTELGDKLYHIKVLAIEHHKAKGMEEINDLNRISYLLNKYRFHYKISSNDISVLPDAVKKWSDEVKPALYTIRAAKP